MIKMEKDETRKWARGRGGPGFRRTRAVFLLLAAVWLLAAGTDRSAAATGGADLTVNLHAGKLTVNAEKTPLQAILDGIAGAYPLVVRGLESRSAEVIDFRAENEAPEKIFKRLLRQLGEKNYAFEFKGQRLSRVSVMPEARGGAVPRPSPTQAAVAPAPEEDLVPVVRVDRVIDGSQAQELDIRSGDLVLEYDGVQISQPGDLIREVKQKSDRANVGMMLLREGQTLHVNLKGGFIGIHIVPHKAPREMVGSYFD